MIILPTEIIDSIVIYSLDLNVGFTLKRFISSYAFDHVIKYNYLKLHKRKFKETSSYFKCIGNYLSENYGENITIYKITMWKKKDIDFIVIKFKYYNNNNISDIWLCLPTIMITN